MGSVKVVLSVQQHLRVAGFQLGSGCQACEERREGDRASRTVYAVEKVEAENADSPTVKRLSGFKIAFVFDIAMTDGDALPTLNEKCAGAGGEELLPRLEAAVQKMSVVLDYEEIRESGVEGYSTGGRIVIRQSLSVLAKCGVVIRSGCPRDFAPA